MNKFLSSVKSVFFAVFICALLQVCKKESSFNNPVGTNTGVPDTAIVRGIDPQTTITQGFFMDGWHSKSLIVPAFTDVENVPQEIATTVIIINPSQIITKVSPYVYGANINPYMTQVVTEPALIKNIIGLAPNLIRAPGGSLSDKYFFNAADSKPPVDAPKQIFDIDGNLTTADPYWYGKNTGSWTLSIDNYYQVLKSSNSTGIITINYAYARYGTGLHPDQVAAHMAADWVRYDKGRTKYWE